MFAISVFKSIQNQIKSLKDLSKAKEDSKKHVLKRIDKIEEKIKSLRLEQAALVLEIEMANASAEALENVLRSGKAMQVSK